MSKGTIGFGKQVRLPPVVGGIHGSIALIGTGNEKYYSNSEGPMLNISSNFNANRIIRCLFS